MDIGHYPVTTGPLGPTAVGQYACTCKWAAVGFSCRFVGALLCGNDNTGATVDGALYTPQVHGVICHKCQ